MTPAALPAGSTMVTVQHVRDGEIVKQVDLSVGDSLTFADCVRGCCDHDLAVLGAAGGIGVDGRCWFLSNLSDAVPLRVWHLERRNEQLTVLPGQTGIPCPFDIAGVAGRAGHTLTVFGPGSRRLVIDPRCAGEVPEPWHLNPGATYHAVLRALCAPRLRGDHTQLPPTARQIAADLGIGVRNVYDHIDYLIDRLGIHPPSGTRFPGWKRAALIDFATTQGLISLTLSARCTPRS